MGREMHIKPITFRQWQPFERSYKPVTINRPAPIADMALEAADALRGWFCCSKLVTGSRVALSFVVGDEVIASEVCDDGPAVYLAVDRLVEGVHAQISKVAA